MKMKQYFLSLALLSLSTATALAQVTGGEFAFEFLRMSNSPHVSALGGIVVANPDDDISLVMQNPSLMRPGLHNNISLNYNSFYAGISTANMQYGYHVPKLNTSFFAGIQYLNYGSIAGYDASGNQNGDFRAADYAISLGASRKYGDHWRYGVTLKGAFSKLYAAYASALLMDVGVNYYDTATMIDFGFVAKNMGSMVQKYSEANGNEPVPFDLQIGISKRFKHMPLRLFVTAHHLYEWNIRYDNPEDRITTSIIGTTDTNKSSGEFVGDKLFRHFIFGAELALGKRLLLTASYNFLRRKELVVSTKAGIAGFGLGVNVNLDKFQVHYARTYYHIAGAYNEIGINMAFNKLFSVGKYTRKMHWDAQYPDWE